MTKPWVRIALLMAVAVASVFVALRLFDIGEEQRGAGVAPKLAPAQSRSIVVAARDVEAGKVLAPADLDEQRWPEGLVPQGSHEKVEPLVGRVARASLASGIPVLESTLLPSGASPEMNWRVAPGYRAMSVETNASAGIAGFAVPGSRVDVLARLVSSSQRREEQSVATTIAQNVRVLAIDQQMVLDPDEDREPADVVTLEVTPREAERLFLALSEGDLHLVLRSAEDSALAKAGRVEVIDLLRVPGAKTEKKKTVKRSRKKKRSVTIIRGSDRAGASVR